MKDENTLWMGDIEPWMDKLFIKNSFNYYGFKPKSIKIVRNDLVNKQFCFISFKNFTEANNALLKLNTKYIPNTKLLFNLNLRNKINNSVILKNYKNVYVGNISPKITNLQFYQIFKSRYPSVYYSTLITNNGIPKGYGFVHFSNEQEYYRCLKEMNGLVIHNKRIKVREKRKGDEDNSIHNYPNDDNSEDVKDLSESPKANIIEREKFSKNIDILESDNLQLLYLNIQENVYKLYQHYKESNKLNEISDLILYYNSKCQCK